MTRQAHEGESPASSGGRLMTGAEIFVRSLIAENVEVLFGYPGGATIGVYDALHDISDIKHVLTRHEGRDELGHPARRSVEPRHGAGIRRGRHVDDLGRWCSCTRT